MKTSEIKVAIVSFTVGLILARFIANFSSYSFDKEIDIVSIFNIFLTIYLAHLVANVYDKRKEKDRVKKDILQNHLDSIYNYLSTTQLLLENSSIDSNKANSIGKTLHAEFALFKEYLKLSNIPNKSDLFEFTNIRAKYRALAKSLTNIPTVPSQDIQILQGNYIYSQARKTDILSQIDLLKKLIFKNKIRINET